MPTNGPLINLDRVLEAMYANFSNLEHNTEYTLEQIVGKERWRATHKGHRTQLGSQFKALARRGELPVRWVDRKDDNKNVYELK